MDYGRRLLSALSLFFFFVLSSVICELYKVMQTRRLADSLCKKDGDARGISSIQLSCFALARQAGLGHIIK